MQSMGLGGGFLMTIYTKNDRKAVTLNARETAPLNATWDMYQNEEQSRKGNITVSKNSQFISIIIINVNYK